jgi:putative redox protein
VTWKEGMAFEASTMGFNFLLDTPEDAGGTNLGPKPKTLLLAALGGCTGMDVISILKKMRIEPDYFNVEVEGELSEEHPKVYHTLQINYIFRGKELPMDKLEKAVNLSQERYCAVTAMLGKSAKISHKIVIEK